jgi:plastocyanin
MRRALFAVIAVVAVGAAPIPVTPAVAGGGGCHGKATEATASTVELQKACFTPTVARVEVGQQVAFVNRDGFTHNIVGFGALWGDIEGLGYGEKKLYTFRETGIFPYACTLHAGMVGAVVVGDEELHAGDAGAVAAGLSGPSGGRTNDASPVAAEESAASWLPWAITLGLLAALVIVAALLARRRVTRQRAIRSAI